MALALVLPHPTACTTSSAGATASLSLASPRPPAPPSRVRWPRHLPFAFARLRKYGNRRRREPVAAPGFDDGAEEEDEEVAEDEEYDDEGEEEMEVDEEEFLATRPRPMGFGEGKTYSTDLEERLLRETTGLGGAGARRRGEGAPAKRRPGETSAKETGADLSDVGVQVRVWNLPKKKNIHKDLKQAFRGFPGLLSVDPVVSANKRTRDPICKGFAFLKLESAEAATRSCHPMTTNKPRTTLNSRMRPA
ncbi:hypothetical protein BS78_K103700 [Paspalum vaginatum]|uniref:RRM domain-containing protein n=1 Tax=Paspalum vaginatum TaxID=158149 RepID=A0A9W8CD16_9POAL|nr:hypothetical protein BS78_K103700 [Paspalum vaginatum]